MRHIRQCDREEYLLSFWIRQCVLNKKEAFPPADELQKRLLGKYPYKLPFGGQREAGWEVCEVATVEDLEDLWMHHAEKWLFNRKLVTDPNVAGAHLRDLVAQARVTGFFANSRNDDTGQMKNYREWKRTGLKGVLETYQKPLLVEKEGHIDICDGFGRLMPYLYLVRHEGHEFVPFQAFLAR
jgi:hypothetical protein